MKVSDWENPEGLKKSVHALGRLLFFVPSRFGENLFKYKNELQNINSRLNDIAKLGDNYNDGNDLKLASQIVNHDIKNHIGKVVMCLEGKGEFENFYSDLEQDYNKNIALAYNIPFLATGDRKYLIDVDVNLLDASVSGDVETINSALFMIVSQEIKNAIDISQDKDYRPNVTIHSGVDYIDIIVSDSLGGIRFNDGAAVPVEMYPKLFEDFSTKSNGGFGLHGARRLIELLDGDIEVISRVDETLAYSTQIGSFKAYMDNAGTMFGNYCNG